MSRIVFLTLSIAALVVSLDGCSGATSGLWQNDLQSTFGSSVDSADNLQLFTTSRLIYISDFNNNVVNVYSQNGQGQTPFEQITGLSSPTAVAVAKNGDLFVYNYGSSTITAYHRGSTSPFETLTGSDGYGLAVDSKENVYASNFSGSNGGTISVYNAGSTIPTKTLVFPQLGALQSVAVDTRGNVFVVGVNFTTVSFQVNEFARGRSKPTQLLVPLRYFPGGSQHVDGLTVDSHRDLIVEDANIPPNPTVSVYAPPYKTIFPVARFSFSGWASAIAVDGSGAHVWLTNNAPNESGQPEGQKYKIATGTLLESTSSVGLSLSYGIATDPPGTF